MILGESLDEGYDDVIEAVYVRHMLAHEWDVLARYELTLDLGGRVEVRMIHEKVVAVPKSIVEYVENVQVMLVDVADDRSALVMTGPLVVASIPRVRVAFRRVFLSFGVRRGCRVYDVDELEHSAHKVAHMLIVTADCRRRPVRRPVGFEEGTSTPNSLSINTVAEKHNEAVAQEVNLRALLVAAYRVGDERHEIRGLAVRWRHDWIPTIPRLVCSVDCEHTVVVVRIAGSVERSAVSSYCAMQAEQTTVLTI